MSGARGLGRRGGQALQEPAEVTRGHFAVSEKVNDARARGAEGLGELSAGIRGTAVDGRVGVAELLSRGLGGTVVRGGPQVEMAFPAARPGQSAEDHTALVLDNDDFEVREGTPLPQGVMVIEECHIAQHSEVVLVRGREGMAYGRTQATINPTGAPIAPPAVAGRAAERETRQPHGEAVAEVDISGLRQGLLDDRPDLALEAFGRDGADLGIGLTLSRLMGFGVLALLRTQLVGIPIEIRWNPVHRPVKHWSFRLRPPVPVRRPAGLDPLPQKLGDKRPAHRDDQVGKEVLIVDPGFRRCAVPEVGQEFTRHG